MTIGAGGGEPRRQRPRGRRRRRRTARCRGRSGRRSRRPRRRSRWPRHGSVVPGRAGRGEEAELVDREVALVEQLRASPRRPGRWRRRRRRRRPSALIGRSRRRRRPRPRSRVELERVVQRRARRRRRRASRTTHRDPDLRGRDHLDVDAGVGQRREERRGDAGVRAHPGADQRHLADLVVVEQLARSRPRPGRASAPPSRSGPSVSRQRERDVGAAGARPRRCSARSCRC